MNGMDRRNRKTEKALRRSLTELLVKKPLSGITVKELTDHADIHRSTFYAHYEDVYQLWDSIEKEILDELTEIIRKDYKGNLLECYSLMIQMAWENQTICRFLFMSDHSKLVIESLSETFFKSCEQYWCRIFKCETLMQKQRYCIDYHVQGCIALLRRWCLSEFDMSVKDMTALITDIDKHLADKLKEI